MQETTVRTKKVASVIRRELAEILRYEVKDPRVQNIGFITISTVQLANDHKNATILVSFMKTEEAGSCNKSDSIKEAIHSLNRVAPFLRSALKKRLTMRTVPELYFRYDKSFDHATSVWETLQNIQQQPSL